MRHDETQSYDNAIQLSWIQAIAFFVKRLRATNVVASGAETAEIGRIKSAIVIARETEGIPKAVSDRALIDAYLAAHAPAPIAPPSETGCGVGGEAVVLLEVSPGTRVRAVEIRVPHPTRPETPIPTKGMRRLGDTEFFKTSYRDSRGRWLYVTTDLLEALRNVE